MIQLEGLMHSNFPFFLLLLLNVVSLSLSMNETQKRTQVLECNNFRVFGAKCRHAYLHDEVAECLGTSELGRYQDSTNQPVKDEEREREDR